tara:strand:- start:48 stop:545 length:498 start_codon:yes stop_codon:yes gene_type:complete
MPKKLINDYIFYKIVCITDDIDLCYVGSTANWKERQREHKSRCNNENDKSYNNKKYQIIRANGGWENFKMIQLGTREQLTKREAEQIEEQYRQELKANMNMRKSYTTEQEIKERRNLYNQREDVKQKQKDYEKKETTILMRKDYRNKNIETIRQSQKQYEINNKI